MVLIIGNVVAFIASLVMVYSGLIKEKKKLLIFQSIEILLFIVSNAVLGGISGVIINAVSFIRNIICYKDKLDFKAKVILSILSTGLVVYFNNLGVIGYFPLIGTLIYLWFMTVKSPVKFKLLYMVLTLFWGIYDITIQSYTSVMFDIFTLITSTISIIRIKKKK